LKHRVVTTSKWPYGRNYYWRCLSDQVLIGCTAEITIEGVWSGFNSKYLPIEKCEIGTNWKCVVCVCVCVSVCDCVRSEGGWCSLATWTHELQIWSTSRSYPTKLHWSRKSSTKVEEGLRVVCVCVSLTDVSVWLVRQYSLSKVHFWEPCPPNQVGHSGTGSQKLSSSYWGVHKFVNPYFYIWHRFSLIQLSLKPHTMTSRVLDNRGVQQTSPSILSPSLRRRSVRRSESPNHKVSIKSQTRGQHWPRSDQGQRNKLEVFREVNVGMISQKQVRSALDLGQTRGLI
jgi:hypothetical protein